MWKQWARDNKLSSSEFFPVFACIFVLILFVIYEQIL